MNVNLVYGYWLIGLCSFGVIFNILNILTLSRKNMTSPVNVILLILAIVHCIFIMASIPYTFIYHIMVAYNKTWCTYAWAVYAIIFMIIGSVVHSIHIWLTILLAVYRHMVVVYPFRRGIWNNTKKTLVIALGICLLSFTIIIIEYKQFYILPLDAILNARYFITTNISVSTNTTYYGAVMYIPKEEEGVKLWVATFLVINCLTPSILHIFLMTKLVLSLRRANSQRRLIFSNTKHDVIKRQTDQTKKMLAIVLCLFTAGLLPRTVALPLVVYSVELNSYYVYFLKILDLISCIDMGATFFIYYTMSSQFRSTLKSLFWK